MKAQAVERDREYQTEDGRATDEYDKRRGAEDECGRMGMIRYHRNCMTIKGKTSLVELEIRHVQRLLDESYALYQLGSPEGTALLFKQTEEFMSQFELDDTMNKHIKEKLLLLLGFLYLAADRTAKEMRQDLLKQTEIGDPVVFLEKHGRLHAFSTEVHIPLMRFLAREIDEYMLLNGQEKFDKLMRENRLGCLLQDLE